MLLVREFKRIISSSYIMASFLIIVVWAVFISVLISSDIRLGVSIFGELTAFKSGQNILYHGINYTKGIGLVVATVISLAIGKEYQYKTWQHLTSNNIKREYIYLVKMVTSIIVAVCMFLIYELIVYTILSIAGFAGMVFAEFFRVLLNGMIIYSILASIICFISIVIKNHIFSLITSIAFVLFEGSVIKGVTYVIQCISSSNFYSYIAKFSLYGMNEISQLQTNSVSLTLIIGLLGWIVFTGIIGQMIFRRIEL